ncbi:hypothetical protein M422DRAFT_774401 [Sphaerobolus stellatus SS14]|nr:hypothetical protein M422DRAFT_774401 [Sphaerobolus stellatus SS14]
MDQDAFRKLLATSKPNDASASYAPQWSSKKKTTPASQPAFQPRKMKKKPGENYRDRASERRVGINDDYAPVESVLKEFEERTAGEDQETIEKQRQYLGGDKDHTILVKGLDIALLEANKAKIAAESAIVEDEDLEAAFHGEKVESTVPKKRTREDIIRELKEKRTLGGQGSPIPSTAAEDALEKAKSMGKFRPIGAPASDSKGKGKAVGEDGKRKKKKRKVVSEGTIQKEQEDEKMKPVTASVNANPSTSPSLPSNFAPAPPKEEADAEPLDNEFDIFADAEEYKGLELEDEDEVEDAKIKATESARKPSPEPGEVPQTLPPRKWFDDPEEEKMASGSGLSIANRKSSSPSPENAVPEDEEEPDLPMKLVPLASSAVPSIRDLLAMDQQAELEAKRKAKKEKKKKDGAKNELSESAKIDRDYQKLNTYMAKKG